MKGLTFLGSLYFYVLVIPLVYWCVDERKGFRLGLMMILSTALNTLLKVSFKQPRPFHLDPQVGMITEQGYGLPSGHAQMSLTMWGIVASWGRRLFFVFAVLISFLIGFSRLYLGVHFHTDLIAGWLIGGVVLALYALCAGPIETLLVRGGLRAQLITTAAAALLINALLPQEAALGSIALGMGGGYAFITRFAGFSARRGLEGMGPKRFLILAARCLTGFTGAALLYLGSRPLAPDHTSAFYRLFNFCRFALLQFWISGGAPWFFLRLGLAWKREHGGPGGV
jgi:membrane-associated phospholipid phosphatase